METLYRLWYNSPRLRGTMSESSCSEDEPLWMMGRCLQLEPRIPLASGDTTGTADGQGNGSSSAINNNNNGNINNSNDDGDVAAGAGNKSEPAADLLERTVSAHVAQMFWSTYRTGFPPITPEEDGPARGEGGPDAVAEGPTTDAGWGCTIRCGQMVVGAALARISGGWGARLPGDLARLFADTPGEPLSIHAITRLGLKKWNKGIGEWFGPSTISVVVSEIVNETRPCGLASCVFPDMMIVREEVEDRACGDGTSGAWKPVLILVTVRVGVSSINPIYLPSLASYFRAPQFLGILGGKDSRHATYFYAIQGSNVFYLDPHTVQPAVGPDGKVQGATNDDNNDVDGGDGGGGGGGGHTSTDGIHIMPIEEADPSMSIAFLCENKESFESLCTLVEGVAEKSGGLVKVVEKAPVMEDFDDAWADDGE